ncbi:alpha,alpha-trehalose-phosphate synthase (UDP-forming) [Pyruvatibacter sp.]|uniref:alpha,alpha-trehalose-phosphate synthase (UDP-forming) n=1 Tax=Pyruvatibacter sp. TaxID=1981328 RepID=UPI003263294B
MSRLVVVSNRVGPIGDAKRAGGLAIALVEALKTSGGIWFGWTGETTEEPDSRLKLESAGPLTLATVDLSKADHEDYYNGFANRSLWPLFHFRTGLVQYDRQNFAGYERVNASFAKSLLPLIQPDDLIWVHDYHFLLFAEELRKLGCTRPIGHFLHIPFPPRELLTTLPHHEQLVQALFAFDILGFQTEHDRDRFFDYVRMEAGGSILGDKARCFGRTVTARHFPIGIDADNFVEFAESEEGQKQFTSMREMLRGRKQIIGVDRLDYTKGLPERFNAFERMLEDHPDKRGQTSLLQVAPPSRSDVTEYQDLRLELEGMAGHINGRFAEFNWTPIRYLNRSFARQALAGLYRASHVGLITPLRDGMNLVAKEYVAAQDPEDPGVLVLSRFAGAAKQMRDAVIINPYDVQGMSDALARALDMPLEERKQRHQALLKNVSEEDISHWRTTYMDALTSVEDSGVTGGSIHADRSGTSNGSAA